MSPLNRIGSAHVSRALQRAFDVRTGLIVDSIDTVVQPVVIVDDLTRLDVDPDSANTYVQLGRVHHAGKNYREALSALEEAVQINPFNPMIYRLLGESYAALGETQKAQAARSNLDKLMGAN